MKHLKSLMLAAVAAGALMAFTGAGLASATVLCSTTADPCPGGQAWPNGTVVDFNVPTNGSAHLTDTNGNALVTCTSATIKGTITNTGSVTETVTGTISELFWGTCSAETKTVSSNNKMKVHKIAGTSNGTVTSDSQIEFEINLTPLFGHCTYGVLTTTEVGTITEGKGTGAVLHANAVLTRLKGPFCPSTAYWTGTYVLTSPSSTTLSVSESGT
jgi:hypothetical protein